MASALGAEYRRKLWNYVDDNCDEPSFRGRGTTLPVAGAAIRSKKDIGEIRVPLVQGMPFFEDLTANAGYRYSSYSIAPAMLPHTNTAPNGR